MGTQLQFEFGRKSGLADLIQAEFDDFTFGL